MTDLIDRLRDDAKLHDARGRPWAGTTCREAADEIERLSAPAAQEPAGPVLDWPAMLLLLNEYAMHVHDASEHQAESRADISKTAALKSLERIRMAMAGHDSRWRALVHELIWRATPAAPSVPAMPLMRSAFRTTVSEGEGRPRYTMVFMFASLAELHAADDEWRAAAPQPGAPTPQGYA